jgi:hypothetical protein
MDRRVARTRKALQHALPALMLKKGYEAITVEDICSGAANDESSRLLIATDARTYRRRVAVDFTRARKPRRN